MSLRKAFARASSAASRAAGQPAAFLLSCVTIVVWAATGPLFQFSDTWQLIINTGTTIATFLMVFLIQNTQNRDSAAAHAKLDELILASRARNEFRRIEALTDDELESLRVRLGARP